MVSKKMKRQIVDRGGVVIDDERSGGPGRRSTDAHCPFYPDNCRDILVTKEEIKPMKTSLKELTKDKMDSWIFKLFLVTFIPIAFIILGWLGYSSYTNLETVTRLEVNQQVLLNAFDIKPKVKPKGG
jgi:hypothetical protein